MKKLGWFAVAAIVAATVGCSTSGRPPASSGAASTVSSTVTPPTATNATTAPVSGPDNACAGRQFTAQQFTGDWTESGDTVITLAADGTLKSRGNNDDQTGTWSYQPWKLTPAKQFMPDGQENQCILWLHWQQPGPPMDLAYFPLKLSHESLELSYIGRGNTITWTRPKNAA